MTTTELITALKALADAVELRDGEAALLLANQARIETLDGEIAALSLTVSEGLRLDEPMPAAAMKRAALKRARRSRPHGNEIAGRKERIVAVLKNSDHPLSAAEIAEAVGAASRKSITPTLYRYVKQGAIELVDPNQFTA